MRPQDGEASELDSEVLHLERVAETNVFAQTTGVSIGHLSVLSVLGCLVVLGIRLASGLDSG